MSERKRDGSETGARAKRALCRFVVDDFIITFVFKVIKRIGLQFE